MRGTRFLIIAAAALFLTACTTRPIYNVSQAPISASKASPSMDEIQKAIVRAGIALGWQMTPDRPGHVLGRIALRNHVAVVDIDYNQTSYSIKYKESTNLDYNGAQIHKNYNGWVQNLDKAIRTELMRL